MLVGGLSASINFLRIILFIPLLNSSVNGLLLYPLSLAIYLNSCINSFMILPPCSNFFNSATFTISSSPPPNSLLILPKFLADSYSISPASKSSSIFSFHTSINCQGYKKWYLVSFFLYFYFPFDLFFISTIFRTLGLGLEVICHIVTSVTFDRVVITLIMGLKEKEVEGSGTK